MSRVTTIAVSGLPVKTAPIENGPSPKRPQFSDETAPYFKIVGQNDPKQKNNVVLCEFSINFNDLTS